MLADHRSMRRRLDSRCSPECTSPTWPISGSELASLIDLGLSDDLIGKYFHVELRKVTALRSYFGLVNGRAPAEKDDCTAPMDGFPAARVTVSGRRS
jgi:hypothetical protein